MNRDKKMVVGIEADTSGFDAAMRQITSASKNFGSIFSSSVSQAIIKGKSFEDTLRSIGLRLSKIALNNAMKPMENIISNITGSIFKAPNFPKGGAFAPAAPIPFAKGGVVAAPAYFNFQGGGGIMGEAGAEAVLPLSRGPDGKLGVATGTAKASPVNVVFNVSATDSASFQRSENQITAMLARAVARGSRNL